jgi:hypothetical protein
VPVPPVELLEGRLQPLIGIVDRRPGGRIGQWVLRHPVRRAGIEQSLLVGEVAVDGRPLDAGAIGDRADRGSRGPDRPVEVDRGLGDPQPGLFLELSPAPLAVGALRCRRPLI